MDTSGNSFSNDSNPSRSDLTVIDYLYNALADLNMAVSSIGEDDFSKVYNHATTSMEQSGCEKFTLINFPNEYDDSIAGRPSRFFVHLELLFNYINHGYLPEFVANIAELFDFDYMIMNANHTGKITNEELDIILQLKSEVFVEVIDLTEPQASKTTEIRSLRGTEAKSVSTNLDTYDPMLKSLAGLDDIDTDELLGGEMTTFNPGCLEQALDNSSMVLEEENEVLRDIHLKNLARSVPTMEPFSDKLDLTLADYKELIILLRLIDNIENIKISIEAPKLEPLYSHLLRLKGDNAASVTRYVKLLNEQLETDIILADIENNMISNDESSNQLDSITHNLDIEILPIDQSPIPEISPDEISEGDVRVNRYRELVPFTSPPVISEDDKTTFYYKTIAVIDKLSKPNNPGSNPGQSS